MEEAYWGGRDDRGKVIEHNGIGTLTHDYSYINILDSGHNESYYVHVEVQ